MALVSKIAEAVPTFDAEAVLFGPQLAFARDSAKFKTACTSRRAGKTVGVAGDILEQRGGAPNLYFTLTRGNAKRIIWPTLLEYNRRFRLGYEPNESELVLRKHGRGAIYLSGADNRSEVEKWRGMGWGKVRGDEAQSFPSWLREAVNDVLLPALMDHDGDLGLIGTPSPVPSGFFYECTKSPKWSHHAWTVFQNPHIKDARGYLDQVLKLRGVEESDPSIQREFYGKWLYDPNALVFRWDAARNAYNEAPSGEWETVIGVDLGFDDADAIAVLGFAKARAEAHLREESVLPKQTITQLAERLAALIEKYHPLAIVMDTGGLGKKIAEEIRKRFALPIKAAEKQHKMAHIELLNDAMRSGRFFAPASSRFAQDCMLVEWDRERSTNDKLVISDRYHSDICDAVLYAFRESLHWLHVPEKQAPALYTPEWYAAEEAKMEEEAELAYQREHEEADQWANH